MILKSQRFLDVNASPHLAGGGTFTFAECNAVGGRCLALRMLDHLIEHYYTRDIHSSTESHRRLFWKRKCSFQLRASVHQLCNQLKNTSDLQT